MQKETEGQSHVIVNNKLKCYNCLSALFPVVVDCLFAFCVCLFVENMNTLNSRRKLPYHIYKEAREQVCLCVDECMLCILLRITP